MSRENANLYHNTAQFYDLHTERFGVSQDIDFYTGLIQPGAEVLEIGCGTGRVSFPLARHGCSVSGVDLSEEMLAIARDKLTAADCNDRVDLHLLDMRDFDLGRRFDWVLFPFRSFQAMASDADRRTCLVTARRHMHQNSRAVITMFNPAPSILASWGKKPIEGLRIPLPGGSYELRRIQRQLHHDIEKQVLIADLENQVLDGDRVLEVNTDRMVLGYLFFEQAEALFEATGFKVVRVWGDYEQRPVGRGSTNELIWILRRA